MTESTQSMISALWLQSQSDSSRVNENEAWKRVKLCDSRWGVGMHSVLGQGANLNTVESSLIKPGLEYNPRVQGLSRFECLIALVSAY